MYIPLSIFFDGVSSTGQMAETDFDPDGISITYTTAQGEKKEIKFEYTSISRVIRKTGDKLLIIFGSSPQQMVEVKALAPIVSILKIKGHRPEYLSLLDITKSSSAKLVTLIVGLIAIGLSLYLYAIPFAADIFARNLSKEFEVNLGNKIYRQIIADDSIDTLKSGLVNRFAHTIDFNTDYSIQVTVVHGKRVNAFATPGGHIIIYDSLLDKLENADELAALLAHEATHIKERHSLRAISRDLSRRLFLSIIFHDRSGISSVLVSNANMLNSLRFSREIEKTADDGAVKIMLQNNINPEGMVQLLNLLNKEARSKNIPSYLSTHPDTDTRIADANDYINSVNIRIIHDKQRTHIWNELKHSAAK